MENRLKLLKNREEKILIDCEKFTITGNNQIKTETIKKTWKYNNGKRYSKLLEDGNFITYPYG